jgi:AcrR family transcriptional regulator
LPVTVTRDRRILSAAESLFFQRGFHAVGIDEIAKKAGITGSGIYRYFSSKDEILGVLFDEALDALFDLLSRGDFDRNDRLDELAFLARTHAEFVVEYQQAAIIMIRDESSLALTHRRRHHRRVKPYIARWIDCLESAYPGRSTADATATTAAVLSLLNSVGQWPTEVREQENLAELLAALARGTYQALQP